jgi:hypothetical protein
VLDLDRSRPNTIFTFLQRLAKTDSPLDSDRKLRAMRDGYPETLIHSLKTVVDVTKTQRKVHRGESDHIV